MRRRRRQPRRQPPAGRAERSAAPAPAPSQALRLPRRSPLHPELARALAAADRVAHPRVRPRARAGACDLHHEPERLLPAPSRRPGRPARLAAPRPHRAQLSPRLGTSSTTSSATNWAPPGHRGSTKRSRTGGRSLAPAVAASCRRRPLAATYFNSSKELWARSYAQAVLTRSEDPTLQRALEDLIERDDIFVWPAEEFEPVADAIGRTFERLGLLRCPGVAAAA